MGGRSGTDVAGQLAPGAQVLVRDEEWVVRAASQTPADGMRVHVVGTSELVRDHEAVFFTELDDVQPLRPEETRLVPDDTPGFRRSRLYLEAMLRRTPVASSDSRLVVAHEQLLNELEFQKRPVHKALGALRPRLLIADAVGLGKTLEVGLLLAELIRRGRGERILVVTPRHILEQFQHELWTRFAIPLVRLDSEGIQRVRQKIPASRNPFTYYKRAIISIDTLKNAGRYRHHLEGIRWDAVVIDECHNLVNRGTLNNMVARVLAPRTDALVLTSATPHNGRPESFAELINMLDPTAIADPKSYDAKDFEHLYVRRHKADKEVAAEVGNEWADRKTPVVIAVDASSAENAVLDELATTWLFPESGRSPTSGAGKTLFPWTLFKAALSSHRALADTVANRERVVAREADTDGGATAAQTAELEALARLGRLAAAVGDDDASKLAALVAELTAIGVGAKSARRVVVFSERIATLNWLAATVPGRLGLDARHVRVLHGGMADVRQLDVIEEFALADSDVRLLFTGDMASEGVNLHRQCHHLVHFDLPWSLITIQQRNGRIDRYGQTHPPEFRALALTPADARSEGDVRVIARLLEREHEAHRALGDAASIMGLHDVDLEEKAIMRTLRDRESLDDVVPAATEAGTFDLLTLISGRLGTDVVPTASVPSLFPDTAAFFEEALREAYVDPDADLDMRREPEYELISLRPPPDLVRRLAALPQSYLNEQKITERMKLTFDRDAAEEALRQARESSASIWPTVAYASAMHPTLDWLADKVLAGIGRNEAPVVVCDVTHPTYLVLGMFSNGAGQALIVEWLALVDGPGGFTIRPMADALSAGGVDPTMANAAAPVALAPLQARIPAVVDAARAHLDGLRLRRGEALLQRVKDTQRRYERWRSAAESQLADLSGAARAARRHRIDAVGADTEALLAAMRTTPTPLVRVLAVLDRER